MTAHFSRILRPLRRAAFCFCCVMLVVCLGLLVSTKWYEPYFGYQGVVRGSIQPRHGGRVVNSNLNDIRSIGADHGTLYLQHYREWAGYEPRTEYFWGCDEAGGISDAVTWRDLLSPVQTARSAYKHTRIVRHDALDPIVFRVRVPLFALANLFAIWPALHFYRLCWAQRQEATA